MPKGSETPDTDAKLARSRVFVDGQNRMAQLYNRGKLKAGNVIAGPAIVLEMDSTTVILPDHVGTVDPLGNLLITPAN